MLTIGRPGATPVHWIGNACRQNPDYSKRLMALPPVIPAHQEQEDKYHADVEKLKSLDRDIILINYDNLRTLSDIVIALFDRGEALRENFTRPGVLIFKDIADARLPYIDEAEKTRIALDNDQLHMLTKLMANVVKLCPLQVRFAKYCRTLNKLQSILGASNIKNDIVAKCGKILANPCAETGLALARALEVAQGVDLADFKDAIKKYFHNCFSTGGKGLLAALPGKEMWGMVENIGSGQGCGSDRLFAPLRRSGVANRGAGRGEELAGDVTIAREYFTDGRGPDGF